MIISLGDAMVVTATNVLEVSGLNRESDQMFVGSTVICFRTWMFFMNNMYVYTKKTYLCMCVTCLVPIVQACLSLALDGIMCQMSEVLLLLYF